MLRDNWNEILIFVTGSTPQIVTETIYCLATHNPPVYPEKIYFITTSHGKEIIQDRLLKNGILKRLFDDYHIPPVSITDESFIIPTDESGSALYDIRDNKDNELMANLISNFISKLTSNDSVRLHKINKELKEALKDDLLLPYYNVSNVKKYASTRYGIRVDKGKIVFSETGIVG